MKQLSVLFLQINWSESKRKYENTMARSVSSVSETPSIRASPFHITPGKLNPIIIIRKTINKQRWSDFKIRKSQKRGEWTEPTIAVEEKSIDGIKEVYSGLRSEDLTARFLFSSQFGDFAVHWHRWDGREKGSPASESRYRIWLFERKQSRHTLWLSWGLFFVLKSLV